MNASAILSAVDECIADLQKKAAAKADVPADPTDVGKVAPTFAADASPEATTGVSGPAGKGKNDEGDLSGVKTGENFTPPSVKKSTDDTDPNPLSKQASDILDSVTAICRGIKKSASSTAVSGAATYTKASEVDPQMSKTSAEKLSQEIPTDPDSIFKIASLVLDSERGREMVQDLARERLGQEQAAAMLDQVDQEYTALHKQAEEALSEEAQAEALVLSILDSDELSKTAKEHFVIGLTVHNKGIADAIDAYEEDLGGEELLKQASENDQYEALAAAESISEAYIHGSQLAKQAAAMMSEQEIGPEQLEALMVELDQYSPEEKIAAVELLLQQGEIPPEVAEELIAAFAEELQGDEALQEGEIPEEYAEGMAKAASVISELEPA